MNPGQAPNTGPGRRVWFEIRFRACDQCQDPWCAEAGECARRLPEEIAEDRRRYIEAGVCSDCGAQSADEAGDKCRAVPDCTGEYSCAGDVLWPDET